MLILIKLVLSFCALSYELILAQGLSAFLDNTVLRYSTTIGLYMFAMGLGARVSARWDVASSVLVLWRTEIGLVLAGTAGVSGLFILSGMGVSSFLVGCWAYLFVIAIGFLTGLELPLLLTLAGRRGGPARGVVLAADYAGAFLGVIAFVFYFYPSSGLVSALLMTTFLNAWAAALVVVRWRADMGKRGGFFLSISFGLMVAALISLFFSGKLEQWLITLYLGQSS